MLNMINGSVQSELSRFFQVIQDKHITTDCVTTSAFTKARKKFSYTAFKALNSCLATTFYESSFVQRWYGLRLLAVDGSITNLPDRKALYAYFGKARSLSSRPSARVSQLYDVINKISVDVQVSPHSTGERELAVKHLECVGSDDLVLYDRGYPAVWLFILHQQKNVNFCMRATMDSRNEIKNFMNSDKNDAVVTLPCIEKSLRKCRKVGLPTSPIDVRMIKVKLKCGETEILITSLLDNKKYPHKVFFNLYHQRWFIEEDYKLMKSRLEMENFSGLSVEAVKQDIHAKVLTKNIAAIAVLEADLIAKEKHRNRKRKYRINFTYALSQLKDNIVRFTLRIIHLDALCIFVEQISKVVDAVRPERTFPREDKGSLIKRRRKRYIAYKRVG